MIKSTIPRHQWCTSRSIDCELRYFTTEFLLDPPPGWTTNADQYSLVTSIVLKHTETGHVWRLTGEHEPWNHTTIWLGRWPD